MIERVSEAKWKWKGCKYRMGVSVFHFGKLGRLDFGNFWSSNWKVAPRLTVKFWKHVFTALALYASLLPVLFLFLTRVSLSDTLVTLQEVTRRWKSTGYVHRGFHGIRNLDHLTLSAERPLDLIRLSLIRHAI